MRVVVAQSASCSASEMEAIQVGDAFTTKTRESGRSAQGTHLQAWFELQHLDSVELS
jgi:hypothetical protein